MTELKFHKLAELFPLLDKTDLDELVKDIRENGQIEPIILYEGEILDGRNRYLACQILGIEPKTEEYKGPDPFKYVISKNLHRRHLTTSQRAMIAAQIANITHGGDRVSEQARNSALAPISQKQAAETFHVSVDSVKEATKLKREAPPEIIKAVTDGETSLNAAKKAIRPEPEPASPKPKGPEPKPLEPASKSIDLLLGTRRPVNFITIGYFIALRNNDQRILSLKKQRIELVTLSFEGGYIHITTYEDGTSTFTDVLGTGKEVQDYTERMELIGDSISSQEIDLMEQHNVPLWFELIERVYKTDDEEVNAALNAAFGRNSRWWWR
jgi:hypothetical protein